MAAQRGIVMGAATLARRFRTRGPKGSTVRGLGEKKPNQDKVSRADFHEEGRPEKVGTTSEWVQQLRTLRG